MSFIEQVMQICDRVMTKAEQHKATTPGPEHMPSPPHDTQLNPKKKAN